MPVNEAERYLSGLAEQSFLKLWTVPNPFKESGKELSDLFIAFGDDIIVFSDKASAFGGPMPRAWRRWRRRTIEASRRQLGGAARSIAKSSGLFLDARASERLPFSLPTSADQRIHLITVARPSHNPRERPEGWTPLSYDSQAGSAPFRIGPLFVGSLFIHTFDGEGIEFLLSQLDTAPDFLGYLRSREELIRTSANLSFSEKDLFAVAAMSWAMGNGFDVNHLQIDGSGALSAPVGLWDEYVASDGATLTKSKYANSRNIDLLIEHFHAEYAAGRNLHPRKQSYDSHESALRLLASESRFSRYLIADALVDLLREENNRTFWASSVPSPDNPDIRYVWLTYPEPPAGTRLEESERLITDHLRQHLLVARLKFGPATYVGISIPNRGIRMSSYSMIVMDGHIWNDLHEEEARHWKNQGVFSEPEPFHRNYKR